MFKEKFDCRWHEQTFQNRALQVVDLGKKIIGPTALTNGKSISATDIFAINEYFEAITPDINIHPELEFYGREGGLKEHCHFSGGIAYKLAVAVNVKLSTNLNPYAQMAALKLHDLGRTVSNCFMETDELTDIFWGQIGIRKDLKELTHSGHLYWDDKELDFDSLSPSTRISVLADVLGKRSSYDPKRLRRKDEVLMFVRMAKERYLKRTNPTKYEAELIKRIPSYIRKEQIVISKSLEWIADMGIDIDQITSEVMEEYKQKEAIK